MSAESCSFSADEASCDDERVEREEGMAGGGPLGREIVGEERRVCSKAASHASSR